ncbi:MAG TPA: class I SAM-dependent methyltransferase [Acidimicrobiales bacterium]|nr:class I SAM-dependent methyltransferase [Acidimicrobiales bacterium]
MRVDYDRQARQYAAGREVPLQQLEPWRPLIGASLGPGRGPVLDVGAGTGLWTRAFVTWFDASAVAVEPSAGMRDVAAQIGVPARACYVAARAEHLPFERKAFGAAWLSTVVHHLADLRASARELRRVLDDGGPVMIRSSFPGRDQEVALFKYFPAAAAVAARWPTLEQVVTTFAEAGFARSRVVRVREERWPDLQRLRDFALVMRETDSNLVPISDAEFADGLRRLDAAIARGERPQPEGVDLLVLS